MEYGFRVQTVAPEPSKKLREAFADPTRQSDLFRDPSDPAAIIVPLRLDIATTIAYAPERWQNNPTEGSAEPQPVVISGQLPPYFYRLRKLTVEEEVLSVKLEADEDGPRNGNQRSCSIVSGYEGQPIEVYRNIALGKESPLAPPALAFHGAALARITWSLNRSGKPTLTIHRARVGFDGEGGAIVEREVVLQAVAIAAEQPILGEALHAWQPAVNALYERISCTTPDCRRSHFAPDSLSVNLA